MYLVGGDKPEYYIKTYTFTSLTVLL